LNLGSVRSMKSRGLLLSNSRYSSTCSEIASSLPASYRECELFHDGCLSANFTL
jgi:hypothetical protein